jgi:hypothetical protein
MLNRRSWVCAGALLAALPWPAAAQPDPLARLDASQRRVVQQFLRKSATDGTSGASAFAVELADIDRDGKAEMVLLWTAFFGNSSASQITLFTPRGTGWREAGSTDVWGYVERLSLEGAVIRIDTLMPGPKDARCCPSLKKVQRVHWEGGKLFSARP